MTRAAAPASGCCGRLGWPGWLVGIATAVVAALARNAMPHAIPLSHATTLLPGNNVNLY